MAAKMRLTSLRKLLSGLPLRRLNHFNVPTYRNFIKPRQSPIHLPNSIASNKLYPSPSNNFTNRRLYSEGRESTTTATSEEVNKAVEEINLKFVEAREEIDLAMESKETVYFNEEALVAKEAVKEVLEMFEDLLKRVGDEEKGLLRRSMGMKIEQLKAELEQLNE